MSLHKDYSKDGKSFSLQNLFQCHFCNINTCIAVYASQEMFHKFLTTEIAFDFYVKCLAFKIFIFLCFFGVHNGNSLTG